MVNRAREYKIMQYLGGRRRRYWWIWSQDGVGITKEQCVHGGEQSERNTVTTTVNSASFFPRAIDVDTTLALTRVIVHEITDLPDTHMHDIIK